MVCDTRLSWKADRNRLEKGKHFQNILGNWLEEQAVQVKHVVILSNIYMLKVMVSAIF